MARQLRSRGFREVAEYLAALEADRSGRELESLADAVSTNLTGFFREPAHFRHLSERFLPTLLDRKRRERRLTIRGWSAGCSSGEEPYTLAMVLDDALQGAAWDMKVLATDISSRTLDLAKCGIYPQLRLRDVPEATLRRHFVRCDDARRARQEEYAVRPELRRIVRFRRLNLMDQPWPFNGKFDFILCRNVMIYFDKPTQERLVQRFWGALESGGLLLTGHSESLVGIAHRFRSVEPTIYEKP